jgi:3-hydroxyacyl-CoA dehydrogenase
MALGGGCEIVMHCTRTVSAFETNIGLVEPGVGLIPAGGGCKEMALRAAIGIKDPACLLPTIKFYFNNINAAEKSASAPMAKHLGYLRNVDKIIMNPYELLYTAKQQVVALTELGYKPPIAAKILVAGKAGLDAITADLTALKEQQKITEHDHFIGSRLAKVLCGGEVNAGEEISEQTLLKLERECFMELLQSEKSKERIAHTLKTGKPLKN